MYKTAEPLVQGEPEAWEDWAGLVEWDWPGSRLRTCREPGRLLSVLSCARQNAALRQQSPRDGHVREREDRRVFSETIGACFDEECAAQSVLAGSPR
jgi:hypothetical protein